MTRNPALALPTSPVRVAIRVADPVTTRQIHDALSNHADVVIIEPTASSYDLEIVDAGAPARNLAAGRRVVLATSAADTRGALDNGANAVLLRDSAIEGLHAALRAVAMGLTVLDPGAADATMMAASALPVTMRTAPAAATARPATRPLSEREHQVVTLMAEGLSNKLIADRLGISDHTAKFHVNGVMTKLGASTRTEAVVLAVRAGEIQL